MTTLVDVHRGSQSCSLNNKGMLVNTALRGNINGKVGRTGMDDERNNGDDG